MPLSNRQLLDSLSRMPFIDSAELAGILGEPHTTVHRSLSSLMADGIAGRVSHGTALLPSSQRYYLTANGIRQATGVLGFEIPSDFVRAYPASREWLTLLIRRMNAVVAAYRLGRLTLPRHRRPSVSGGVLSQGAVRRHHHPARRPQPVALRPAEGHSLRYPRSSPGTAPTASCPRTPEARSRDLFRADVSPPHGLHEQCVTPFRGPEMPLTAPSDARHAPPLQSHFSGSNVIGTPLQPARRCHCSPEHRDSTKCFLITSCRRAIYPCFSLPTTQLATFRRNSNSCTPPVLRGRGRKTESL